MCNKQKAYDIVDSTFISFISDNRKWVDELSVGEIKSVSVTKKFNSRGVLCAPWHVCYVGKTGGGEGDTIVFLDSNLDKLYSYYDVE